MLVWIRLMSYFQEKWYSHIKTDNLMHHALSLCRALELIMNITSWDLSKKKKAFMRESEYKGETSGCVDSIL